MMLTNAGLKKIERFFLSRNVAVALLTLILILLILSTRISDVTKLTTSPFFLVLPLLIFLSTLFCTLNRLKARRFRAPDVSAFRVSRRISPREIPDATACLKGKGWSLFRQDEDTLLFTKGAVGFWGSMLFHAGLLTMLIAAVITSLTLFSAELLLTQGLPISLGREGFLKIWREPILPAGIPGGEITLDRFEAVYKDERFPVDYIAQVKVRDIGERVMDVRVNEPLILGKLQYTIDRYGFAPGFLIKDVSGNILFDGYVSLVLMGGMEDFFEIPGTDLTVYVRFFPDFVMTETGPSTRSRLPKNPVLGLRIKRGNGEPEKGRLVKMGDEVEMAGVIISPNELRYWAHFGVARDAGKPVLFVSIVLMVAGLVVRFIYHERWLRVKKEAREDGGCEVEVSGYSRYFPALFEGEVERVAADLSREV